MNAPTGKFVSPETLARLNKMAAEARTMPVMTVRSDLPTFAEMALMGLQTAVNEAALAIGLPDLGCDEDGDQINYGIKRDGEVIGWAPDPKP